MRQLLPLLVALEYRSSRGAKRGVERHERIAAIHQPLQNFRAKRVYDQNSRAPRLEEWRLRRQSAFPPFRSLPEAISSIAQDDRAGDIYPHQPARQSGAGRVNGEGAAD